MLSAVMHAGWNLFVKKDENQFLSLTVMAATSGVLCALLLPLVPSMDASAWKVLAISAPLHAGYRVCLSLGYKYGDMSQVYPIARGATPLLVTLISVFFLNVHLGLLQSVGIFVIAAGIMGLTFYRGLPRSHEGRAIGFALGTAAFIAVFTLLDSAGSRNSGSPLAYVLWLFVLEGALMLLIAAAVNPPKLLAYVTKNVRTCSVNGLVMSVAHGLIILALSRSEAALVSALRETSVIFGVVFSALVLKERIGLLRLACTLAVMGGIMLTILG
ncbi:MAG: EamA family transporter [Nitrospira sp.]|nr:EamA family transporter [Nitrospira sp.]